MDQRERAHPFRLNGALNFTRRRSVDRLLEHMVEKASALRTLDDMYQALPPIEGTDAFLQTVFDLFNIRPQWAEHELAQIPATGAAVVVANHPFGALEGLMMAAMLRRVRSDVKILANYFLQRVPELDGLFIGVDPFGGGSAAQRNVAPMKEALRWLQQGGLLVIFPAGEVSHLRLGSRVITDPAWHPAVARLVRRAEVPVIPIYFHGSNSLLFQLAGLLHPRLRTALLPRELLNKRNRAVPIRIGNPIPFARLKGLGDEEATAYLRMRCYTLGARGGKENDRKTLPANDQGEPVAAPVPTPLLQAEVAALPPQQCLDGNGTMQVFYARAGQIPWLLQEIGRLREEAFRAAGEGTGHARDIDLYDAYYLHLFIWDSENSAVVGAYRLGLADEIVHSFGRKGLYTHSLFNYGRRLLDELNPAIELGRSFVRLEYQRSYTPLLLLWKGIGRFVAQHPQYRVLFGPVSISSDYQSSSQQLLVDFLRANNFLPRLARHVRPRRPFRATLRHAPNFDTALARDLDGLSELVSAIEHDQKGVPVLLRQYLKLGGHILGFNVDDQFNNALDGLIMVDLRQTDAKVLAKYMGREQAEQFRALHSETAKQASA